MNNRQLLKSLLQENLATKNDLLTESLSTLITVQDYQLDMVKFIDEFVRVNATLV